MNYELQKNLFSASPLLYKYFRENPQMQMEIPNDLFEFIFELSVKIEDFNRRFPRRRVRVMKLAMESGELIFAVNRQVFTVDKLITGASAQIRNYRRSLKQAFLERAKAILCLYQKCHKFREG